MTLDEFFDKLKNVDEDIHWEVEYDGLIRGSIPIYYKYLFFFKSKVGEKRFCPLTAAADIEGMDYIIAGQILGLTREDRNEVVSAADGYPEYGEEIRSRLLSTLNILEKK